MNTEIMFQPGFALWSWLLKPSVQAGVMVPLILLAQWVFRRQLGARWRFALWWLVVVRLLLPVSLGSAVSLFNWVRWPAPASVAAISTQQAGRELLSSPENSLLAAARPPAAFPNEGSPMTWESNQPKAAVVESYITVS